VETDDAELRTPVEPPNGMYPARVDDKGRLKLPVAFQQYFSALPEKKLFVTSLDRRIGQIYPIPVWRENKKHFLTVNDPSGAVSRVWFTANAMGADTEMDAQGRILLPPELRRKLGIENQNVHLCSYKGRIQIYSGPIYEEEEQKASQSPQKDVEVLEQLGLQ
jgi:MraZ protein